MNCNPFSLHFLYSASLFLSDSFSTPSNNIIFNALGLLSATFTHKSSCCPSDRLLIGRPFINGFPFSTVNPFIGICAVSNTVPW